MTNIDRIGKSEVELIQSLIDSVSWLIELEKRAASGDGDATKAEMEASLSSGGVGRGKRGLSSPVKEEKTPREVHSVLSSSASSLMPSEEEDDGSSPLNPT